MAQINAFLKLMIDQGASDLHLAAGSQPLLRINGELEKVKYKVQGNDELKALLYEFIPEDRIKFFEETGDLDFAYEVKELGRFRVNFYQHLYGVGAAFRLIPSVIKTIDDLGLPQVLKRLALLPKGLVLLTGPTGSGKSTTLAAILDHSNRNRKDHIITIEDPVEFVHQPVQCTIHYREIGLHTRSFSTALRAALREDPDIILVGEMRDLETISLAIEAAETGHLVLATLHTISASKTIDRIIEVFPAEQQGQIRMALSESLRAVVAQTLFKRTDQKGRVAALEILIATHAMRNMIRENKTYQIISSIQTGKKYGMQSLDDSILELLNKKMIFPEEAYMKSLEKAKFIPFLRVPPSDFTEV
jgi:twitching motility protein PilT